MQATKRVTALADYRIEGAGEPALVLDGTAGPPGRRSVILEAGASAEAALEVLDELVAFGVLPAVRVDVVGDREALRLAGMAPERVRVLTVRLPEPEGPWTSPVVDPGRALAALWAAVRAGRAPTEALDAADGDVVRRLTGRDVGKRLCAAARVPARVEGTGVAAATVRRWLPDVIE